MSFNVGDQVQVIVRGEIVQTENTEGEIQVCIKNVEKDNFMLIKVEDVILVEDKPATEKISAGYNTFGDSIL